VIENFFEDESLESNSDDSVDDEDDGDDEEEDPGESGSEVYKRYFGIRPWKGMQTTSSFVSDRAAGPTVSSSHRRPSPGPSSDMLSPVVTITLSHPNVMNGQNVGLAVRWRLGKWDKRDDVEMKLQEVAHPQSLSNLPHYRDLLPVSPNRENLFSRTRSDPNLFNSESQKKLLFDASMDEPGVHGGNYTVRPNMEESMTFLKKLYSHQQEAGTTFSTLLSPPDSPIREFRHSHTWYEMATKVF
jgi:hypothetical protein